MVRSLKGGRPCRAHAARASARVGGLNIGPLGELTDVDASMTTTGSRHSGHLAVSTDRSRRGDQSRRHQSVHMS